jgi:hypothetical protein
MGTTMDTTTSANDSATPARVRRWINTSWPETLPRGLFVAEVLARGLSHIVQDDFRGAAAPESLAAIGEPVLVRAEPAGTQVEAFVLLDSDVLAFVEAHDGNVSIEVAAEAGAEAQAVASALRQSLADEGPAAAHVSMAFWMRGDRGGTVRHREIEAPAFESIASNYPSAVRHALSRLIRVRAPETGRLILWRGAPGTGKSHALRSLARAWAPWCSAHFIMDPDELFGRGGAYMLDVLAWDGDGGDRWRLVILEDAGELITADARAAAGQALSTLLNVADGLLGQGTRTLVVITTNEPVKSLHPATRRAGRCLADLEFTPFPVGEANAWLAAHGDDRRVEQPTTLAELYSNEETAPQHTESPATTSFGFARALATAQDLRAERVTTGGGITVR